MIAAEEWYQQQTNYQKYGLDMAPERPKPAKSVKKKKQKVTAKDRMRLMTVIFLVGMVFIGVIIVNAFSATVNYNINDIQKQNAALQGEIETLSVEINSAKNIEAIEDKATGELGMVAPSAEKSVYLEDKDVPTKNLAKALKKNAYN